MSYFEELLEKLKTTTNKSTKNTTKKRKDEDYFDRIVSKVASLAEEKRTAQEDDIAPTKVGGGGRSFDDTSTIKTKAKLDTDGKRASSLTDESLLDKMGSNPLMGGSLSSLVLQERQREKEIDQAKGTGLIREKQRTWLNGDALGVFRDGYQLGDISKILLGTGQDIADDLTAGALGIGESVVDTAAYGIGAVADLFGHPTAKVTTEEFIKKDLYDEVEVAKTINQSPAKMILRLLGVDDAEDTSALGEKSDSLSQSGGQLLGQVALQSVGVPWYVTSGASSFGSEAENALEQGASFSDAGWSAAISAGAEILTEKMFGGSGLGEKGFINLNSLTEGITDKAYKALADYGIDILAEGSEEVVSEFISRLGQQLTYEKEATWEELLSDEEAMDRYINQFTENLFGREAREAYGESFIGGSVLGGTMNVGNVRNSVKNETDYRTGLNADDQTVFDKVLEEAIAKAEKDGKKLTKNEKAELYDSVMEDLENGSIDVDDIERILGGDSYTEFESGVKGFNESELYKAYRDAVKEESDLKTEFDELSKVKANEADLGQQARFSELQKKLEEMKTNAKSKELRTQLQPEIDRINSIKARLRSEVSGRVKEGKLSESYRELLRSTEKFTADVSKYENENAKKTIQNIIDSGLTDNSNKMHRFVDFLAKISEDKGVTFSLTDAKKLAGTIHDFNGAVANAFVNGNEITLNTDSKKMVETTVGHEITHVLEGTEFYNQLAETVKQYATVKGEWDSRLKGITELYQKYDPKADPEKELIADLVGDYVFTDSKFVNNLSTKNRNVFQKVYDEIKYLLKIATAGSEEARALEKVRKVFEKAWRSSPKTDGKTETQHSISETTDGRFAAIVDNDILSKISTDNWDKATKKQVQKAASEELKKFVDGFTINGIEFVGNKKSRAEYTRSNYSEALADKNLAAYLDKMRSAAVLDDVIQVATDWKNDGKLKYAREDYVDFVRGNTLIKSGDRTYRAVVLAGITKDGKAIFHDVVDVYPEAFEIKKAEPHTTASANELPNSILRDSDGGTVAQEEKKVNRKFSLSDSNGKQLTDAQAEFFKDSVVRDDNGNLKVMYHGTSRGGFTVFDTYRTKYGLFGNGFYFTESKNIGESYTQKGKGKNQQVYEAYLNIKNPMDMDAQANPDEWARAFDEVDFPESGTNEQFYRAMEEYYTDQQIAKWEVEDIIRETLEYGMGYDGITHMGGGRVNADGERHRVYIAFNPEQIKNTDNVNPTSDPDIRYSLSEDTNLSDKAISLNESLGFVTNDVMSVAKALREETANRLKAMKDNGVAIPDDIKGNTAIANSSYDITEENTTICPRSLAAEAFTDAVSEYLGRPLTVEEQIYISQDLQGRSLTPECTYCYVATDRKAYRAFLGEYIAQRDAVLQKLSNNSNADTSRSGEMYKAFLDGRKDTNPMYDRFRMWVNAYKNGTPMIDGSHLANISKLMGDITSEFGEALKPQIKDAMKYAQSASWAKKRVNYVAYDGHILKWKQNRIDKLNSHYGLRMYSFSDFHPAFVLENMQMITDASVRGLKMLGYTKDTDFVEIFAPSGMNINISTFGFESGGNVYENNIIGANWDKAKALREQNPNVGITFVATNDTLVNWALEQDWIDVVIPYHLVRTGEAVAKAFNYTNYTSESSDTKTKDWQKGKDQKYIAPTEHNNDKATYLAALEKNHLKPRFERFLDNPNYMKLVNECRQPASMSKPVQPVFNEDAINTALAKLEANGYYQPVGGSVDRMYEIAAEVAENMTSQLAPVQHSLSTDGDAQMVGRGTYWNDVRLRNPSDLGFNPLGDDIAPIGENVQNTAQNTMNNVQENTNVPFDAPVQAGDAEAVNDISTITDADAPPVVEAPMPDNEPVKPHDPFAEKNIDEVGKRNVHAYMSDHPEVKPYFQQEANIMLGELRDTVKGERIYNEEGGWTGTSRHTSEDIAYLRDALGYTYAEIEKGLNAIIEDHGKENIAVAKKIEFILNDRLLKGYRDFATGMDIPANESYIKLLNNGQIMSYDDGYMDALVASEPPPAKFDAPVMTQPVAQPKAPVQGDIAPTQEYEAIRPKQPNQPKMIRVDAPVAEQHTAQILTEAKAKPKEKFNAVHKAVELLVDKGAVFERLSKETKNRELEAKYNYLHYSNGNAQNFIGNGDPEKGVSSLTSIMEQVGERSEDFFSYLYHIHNADRMTLEQRGFGDNKAVFGSHVSADMSNAIWRQIERTNPDFRQLATQVYGINQYLRQMMVDGGLISQDTANLWSQMYPHYVPISRADYEAMAVNVPLDTNKTGVNAPVKMATGGDSDISPLFNTMAKRILQTYRAVDKNSFGVELMNTLGKVNEKTATDFDAVMDGIDAHEELLQEGKNGNAPTFTVFENGERTTFDITKEMYDAMKPTSDALAYTNKFLNGLSNFRRGLITEYNPVFLATNAIKDAQDVLINSQHPMKTYANFPRAWAEMIGNGKWYKEYMTHGGGENTYFDRVSDSFDTKEKGLRKLLGVPHISWIGKANNFLERVPRLAEYIASRESDRSIEVSMLDAARVTTNFAAGGDATKLLNRNGFTFLNASVQGAAQQVRNVQEAIAEGKKGVLKLVGKTVMAGLPALLLNHLLWDDDEEYEELSDYVKENYYIVGKFGDGQFVRIPKGRTVAVIQEAFQQMKGAMTGDDDIDFMKWAKLAFSNLAPNDPLNNFVASPIIQASTNKAWHGGDIVPQSLQDVPVEEQYDEGTDMFSRWVGDVFNISPMKVNYVLDQYSGGIGDTFLPMMTPEAERGGDSIVGKLVSPWVDKFTTDSVLNNQNVTDFYDLKDKLTINANSSKATDEDMLHSKYMNSVNSELSDLYKEKREIQNSRKYSDSEKFEMVRDIQEQINERMKDAMSTYEDVAYETDAKTGEKYAVIGDKYFKLTDEEHEYEWSILSKEQTEKYKITSAAGDANYATDGKTHYAWSEPDEDDLDGKPQWRKLTDKQVAKQEDVTKKLGITPEEYWADRDEDTVKMYDWVYENPEKYEVSRAVAKDFKDYWQYKSDLDSLDAKDANGKSVNGLKKERVIDYINQMDADYGERIVLFRSYYPKDDTYNADIVEYLNNRNDISYTQMVKILTELDMKVHADGTVTWD